MFSKQAGVSGYLYIDFVSMTSSSAASDLLHCYLPNIFHVKHHHIQALLICNLMLKQQRIMQQEGICIYSTSQRNCNHGLRFHKLNDSCSCWLIVTGKQHAHNASGYLNNAALYDSQLHHQPTHGRGKISLTYKQSSDTYKTLIRPPLQSCGPIIFLPCRLISPPSTIHSLCMMPASH